MIKYLLTIIVLLSVGLRATDAPPSRQAPLSKEQIRMLLAAAAPSEKIAKLVRERGIDFDPDRQVLQAFRKAGAQPALLAALRNAKRVKPFVVQTPPASRSLAQGGLATLLCDPAEKDVPVFADPRDLGLVAARLGCGARVNFLGAVSSPPGFDKIQYAEGKEGFVANSYLEPSIAAPGGTSAALGANVTAPVALSKPDAPYTPEARHKQIEGNVTLQIIVDAEGNVTGVQETSSPLGAGLDQSAIETVKTWKFKPATRNGVAVPVRVLAVISFRLDRKER